MSERRPVTALMMAIAECCLALGIKAPCTLEVDTHWTIAVSGDKQIVAGGGENMSVELPAYHFAVWFNGWLAGIGSPYSGTIAAGKLANENTLLAALKKKQASAAASRN